MVLEFVHCPPREPSRFYPRRGDIAIEGLKTQSLTKEHRGRVRSPPRNGECAASLQEGHARNQVTSQLDIVECHFSIPQRANGVFS